MTQSIRAVDRAFHLVRVMNARETWTLYELAAATSLAKTTVHRLLATLEQQGYVRSPAGTSGVYRLTTQVGRLSTGLTTATRYTDACDPIVVRATRSLRWPVTFALPEAPYMRMLACGMPHSPEHASKPTTYGQRRWMFDSAVGRVYLSRCSGDEVAAVRRKAETVRQTANPALVVPPLPLLLEDLKEVRSKGYAVRIATTREMNSALAVPVERAGMVIGALVCSTFPHSLSEHFIDSVLIGLRATATEIAEACLN